MLKAGLTLLLTGTLAAQTAPAPAVPSTNAALRYWMAFAALQNPPADDATARLLDDVASGSAPWDEARLGPIVEQNAEALAILRRASTLTACAWGLEVELGPEAPMLHLARGRALARLNVLHGIRLQARGADAEAIDTWLAGVRFARHFGQDGPLVQLLVAGASLSANLKQIERAAAGGHLDAATLARVERALRDVPPYAFDWPQAWTLEAGALEHVMRAGPDDLQRLVLGSEPSAAERERLARDLELSTADLGRADALARALTRVRPQLATLMQELAACSRLPYTQARERLQAVEAALAKAHPFVRRVVPSPSRANQARAELEANRAGVLGIVLLQQQRLRGRQSAALAGLDLPEDPFAGRPFDLVTTDTGAELRSQGRDGKGQPLVYRLAR